MSRFLVPLVFLFSISVPAAAYLDPGTGSMILQGIIAGIAVAGFTIKTYWYRIQAFFGKEQAGSLLDEDENNTDTKD